MSGVLGRGMFASGMIGFGVLSLIYGKYALQWQPVPETIPIQLAYVSGLILVMGGVGLFGKKTAFAAALTLMVFLFLWVVALQAPPLLRNLANVGAWLPLCEDLAMACGAWILLTRAREGAIPLLSGSMGVDIARVLFGLCCIQFGASHFAYADFTAQMVPEWLPQRLWLAYLTGACHCAAGIALVTGIKAKLAATLEAVMMSAFVVLVHIPMVLVKPSDGTQLIWTMLFAATAMAGSAWLMAAHGTRDKAGA